MLIYVPLISRKLPTAVHLNLFYPTTRADVFIISIPTWLKKEEPYLYEQKNTGRLNLFKNIVCRLNRMDRKLIALLLGVMGFGLQCGQCWFQFHSCKGHCPPRSIKTCSAPPGEQMYFYLYFSHDWRKNSHLLETQQRPTGWTDF